MLVQHSIADMLLLDALTATALLFADAEQLKLKSWLARTHAYI